MRADEKAEYEFVEGASGMVADSLHRGHSSSDIPRWQHALAI